MKDKLEEYKSIYPNKSVTAPSAAELTEARRGAGRRPTGKSFYKAEALVDVYPTTYEGGDEINSVSSYTREWKAKTLKELLQDIASSFSAKVKDLGYGNLNEYEWASEIWFDYVGEINGFPLQPGDGDFEAWKRGEVELFSHRAQILVSRVGESPVPQDIFKRFGLQSIE